MSTTHRFLGTTTWQWFQKILVVTIFSLVVNHLATRDNFLDSESYRFPIEGFLSTIVLFILIGIIADLNFRFYKKKYFTKKVTLMTIVWFMLTTLGYIAIMYIPVNILKPTMGCFIILHDKVYLLWYIFTHSFSFLHALDQ